MQLVKTTGKFGDPDLDRFADQRPLFVGGALLTVQSGRHRPRNAHECIEHLVQQVRVGAIHMKVHLSTARLITDTLSDEKQWDGLLLSLTASKVPDWKKRVFQ